MLYSEDLANRWAKRRIYRVRGLERKVIGVTSLMAKTSIGYLRDGEAEEENQ